MNIVLHQPEIALNTGNIGRTCVSTNTKLHLIRPLGFIINDKNLKRAGMDYWQDVKVYYYDNFDDFLAKNGNPTIYMATTKALKSYTDVKYSDDDFIMFGSEGQGIPEEILLNYKDTTIRIPMLEEYRSLNLSNSVAIVLYEALKQNDFKSLQLKGNLHKYNWNN